MAEESQPINMVGEANDATVEEYEEFYENIEAPKFVDFAAPDHYHPDDRYWFCLRVGCDQKHEEELDSEAIYKNFVLRVMAARSPNVRFQKALNRNGSSKAMKCPLSAPPKPSKPKVSRIALMSSISGKLVADKGEVRALPKKLAPTTPKAKTKQIAAKYLTTPRNRKCLPDSTSFRSVQHSKPTSLAVPNKRTVAKALVFHSPKKTISIKTSVELRTPLSRLCKGMKRLEISSPRREGCSSKALIKKVTFKEECSEKIGSGSQTQRAKNAAKDGKSSRSLKNNTKRIAGKGLSPATIDQKPRKYNVEQPRNKEISGELSISSKLEQTALCSEIPSSTGTLDSVSSEPTEMGGNDLPISKVPNREKGECREGYEEEDHPPENQIIGGAGPESEVIDSDDKENDSAFDENRCVNNKNSERRSKSTQQDSGKMKTPTETVIKNSNERVTRMRVKKPKPTNPKPFRLRTDERGILKEANMEKKVFLLASKTETSKHILDGKSKRKQERIIQGHEKLPEKCNSEMVGDSGRLSERTVLGDLTSEGKVVAGQKALESDAKTPPRSLHQEGKMRSPLKRDAVHPERLGSSGKATTSFLVPAQRLGVIKEAASPVTKPRNIEDRTENKAITANDCPTSSTPSQKKRPLTIPKEPNFHTAHRPRSCTKPVA